MRIKWKRRAEAQYQEHIVYCLRQFGRFSTLRFQEKIEKQLDLLKDFPHLGKVELLLIGRRYAYRSLVVHPFFKLVYYINDEKGIIVITNFWDVRQEPQRLVGEVDMEDV